MAGAGGASGWRIEVTNLRQVFNALDEMDKQAAKSITKEITKAGKEVVSEAKSLTDNTPLSSWGQWTFSRDGRDLSFDVGRVVAGFTLRKNNYRRKGVNAGIGWDVWQKNPGGAIFEVIGDKSRVGENPPFTWQGAGFVDRISGKNKRKQPRTLIQAYYRVMTPELRERIKDQIIAEAQRLGLK